MRLLKDLKDVEYDATYDSTLTQHYVYGYYKDGEIYYAGIGSDANRTGNGKYWRARDFDAHNDLCKLSYSDTVVKIEHYLLDDETAENVETTLMFANNLLEEGANLKYSVRPQKFWTRVIDSFKGQNPDLSYEDTVQLIFESAVGDEKVEPLELTDHILSRINLEPASKGVVIGNNKFGGYNLSKGLVSKTDRNSLIMAFATQDFNTLAGVTRMNKKNNLTINTMADSYMSQSFIGQKVDFIFANPPWKSNKTQGIVGAKEFIDKAAFDLKPGGKMAFIVSQVQFTPKPTRKGAIPGSLLDLAQRGTFERIETFKGMSSRDYFNNFGMKQPVGDWCWFVWRKDTMTKSVTKMVNRDGKEFDYVFQDKEYYIPQLQNESEYFDWDTGVYGKWQVVEELDKDGVLVVPRTHDVRVINVKKGDLPENAGVLFSTMVSASKLEEFLNGVPDLYTLYTVSQSGERLRIPPIKRELVLRDDLLAGETNGDT